LALHQERESARERALIEATKRAEARKARLDSMLAIIPSLIKELRLSSPGFDAYMTDAERLNIIHKCIGESGLILSGIALATFGGGLSHRDTGQFREVVIETLPTIMLVDGEDGVQGIFVAQKRHLHREHNPWETCRLSSFDRKRHHALCQVIEALANPERVMLTLFEHRGPKVLV
jgi:hypothetical protein